MYFSESRLKRVILTFSWRKYNYCFSGAEGRQAGGEAIEDETVEYLI